MTTIRQPVHPPPSSLAPSSLPGRRWRFVHLRSLLPRNQRIPMYQVARNGRICSGSDDGDRWCAYADLVQTPPHRRAVAAPSARWVVRMDGSGVFLVDVSVFGLVSRLSVVLASGVEFRQPHCIFLSVWGLLWPPVLVWTTFFRSGLLCCSRSSHVLLASSPIPDPLSDLPL